jgi:hypothetical protein
MGKTMQLSQRLQQLTQQYWPQLSTEVILTAFIIDPTAQKKGDQFVAWGKYTRWCLNQLKKAEPEQLQRLITEDRLKIRNDLAWHQQHAQPQWRDINQFKSFEHLWLTIQQHKKQKPNFNKADLERILAQTGTHQLHQCDQYSRCFVVTVFKVKKFS